MRHCLFRMVILYRDIFYHLNTCYFYILVLSNVVLHVLCKINTKSNTKTLDIKSFNYFSGQLQTKPVLKKDRKRHHYDPENLQRAVQAVRAGVMNTYQAARYFNVPRGTISNKIYVRKNMHLQHLR